MESFTVAFAENEDDAKNVQQHSVSYAKKNLDTSNAAFSLFGGDDDIEKQGKEKEEEEEDIAARWERLAESPAQCSTYFTPERIVAVQDKV